MSYQVIARKYRPQRFADVVGQEHVTQTLANAIQQKRIAHAYLFCGPRGTGKTTIARIFAKCLNCTGGPKVDFDDADPRCIEIAEGRSIDVLEIDGASNNGVEQVRELRETCKYAPASSKFKIYIIDEVHMLSTAAFNALLKTLEEPPAHVKFMFATTDPEKVLPTILSRCQRFDLRRIPVSLIIKHLTAIAKKEKVRIDQPALYAIARGADGGLRDAESALDQLISFCGDRIEESDVLSMFGLTAQDRVLALVSAMLHGDAADVLRDLNDLAKHGKDLGRILSDLLNYFRNLLIYQVSGGDLALLEVSEAETATLKDHAALANTDTLTRVMEVLAESEGRLRDATSKKIFLEVALLRAIQARNALSIDAVLKQLDQLRQSGGGSLPARTGDQPAVPARRDGAADAAKPAERRVAGVNSASPPGPATAAPPVAPVEAADAMADAPTGATTDLGQLWANLLAACARVGGSLLIGHLQTAFPVSFDKGIFAIGFDPEFEGEMELANTPKNTAILQTKLAELGHRGSQVKFVKTSRPGAAVAPAPAAVAQQGPAAPPAASAPMTAAEVVQASGRGRAKTPPSGPPPAATQGHQDFKDDPLIKKALEVFRGRIVEPGS